VIVMPDSCRTRRPSTSTVHELLSGFIGRSSLYKSK
jgi:hypothetical protein